ncbi:hypothetical protein RHOSPDRAFT_27105 [Rhodotorula sp. JG-1b]|nr:hypothetical protein RHOSPDRAFT_27105 [Rhodotorula sp. JG-1b]
MRTASERIEAGSREPGLPATCSTELRDSLFTRLNLDSATGFAGDTAQIWPFHRLVCGARSHPFKLPKEKAKVTFARTVDLPESAQDAGHQIYLQRLMRIDQYSRDELEDRIDSLIGVETPMLEHRYPDPEPQRRCVPAKSPSLGFLETFYASYNQLTAAGHDVADDSRWYSEYCHRVSVQLALMLLVTSATKEHGGGDRDHQNVDDKLVEAREANMVPMRHFLEKMVNDPRLGAFAQSGIRAAEKTLEMLRQLYGRKVA